jgi:hypothetical protein
MQCMSHTLINRESHCDPTAFPLCETIPAAWPMRAIAHGCIGLVSVEQQLLLDISNGGASLSHKDGVPLD